MKISEKRFVTRRLTEIIRNYHVGALEDPCAWTATVRRAGCGLYLHDDPDGQRGQYWPPPQPGSPGLIIAYEYQAPEILARVIAHEVAHHLMRTLTTASLFEGDTPELFDDDPAHERHAIACNVVDALFAPPRAKRPKRKAAPPDGGLFRDL